MNMRKIAAVFMVTVMMVSMAGCGTGTSDSPNASADNNAEVAGTPAAGTTSNGTTLDSNPANTAADNRDTQQNTNVELSLKGLIDSISFEKEKVTDGVTYQKIADDYGAKYLGADVNEDVAFNSERTRVSSNDGSAEYEIGLSYYEGEGAKYGVNIYIADGSLGDSYSQVSFNLDGSFSKAMTNVEETAVSGKNITDLDVCAAYINDTNSYSLTDFIKALGLDSLDANFLSSAEAIMSGQFTSYAGEFETEYGKATVSLSCFTVEPSFPTGVLTIKFADSSAPVKGVSFQDTYYTSFMDSAKRHSVSLTVGDVLF